MTLKVAVPASLSQAGKDYLTNKGYTLIETADQSAATLAKEATDADGIVLNRTLPQQPGRPAT